MKNNFHFRCLFFSTHLAWLSALSSCTMGKRFVHSEAIPVKLANAFTVCSQDEGNIDWTKGYVEVLSFGGSKEDKCVSIRPSERSDTYSVYVGKDINSAERLTGTIFHHSRRTQVSNKLSGNLASFIPIKDSKIKGNIPLFIEISDVGMTVIKNFKTDLDVAMWAPDVKVIGTSQKNN